MQNNRTIIIQCSSRVNGDSGILTTWICQKFNTDNIALCELNIHPFDYNNLYESDDFLKTIQNIVENYQHIIFVTPVYWYTMSSNMKMFLDRFSDLLKWYKETGRKLRGMSMGLISVSNDPELQEYFEIPVKLSAEYLGMVYLGHTHSWVDEGKIPVGVEYKLENYFKPLI